MTGVSSQSKLDIDLGAPAYLADSWPSLRALQDNEPVLWSDIQGGWIVTRHEDVWAALQDDGSRFSAERILPWLNQLPGITEDRYPNLLKYFPKQVSFRDGAAHTRLRRLFLEAFNRRAAERMRHIVQEIIKDLLDQAAEKVEMEFVDEIAMQLPTRLLTRIIGIPERHREDFYRWTQAILPAATAAKVTHESLDLLERNLAAMTEVILAEIADRRDNPQDDLLSALVRAHVEGDRLSEEELVAAIHITILAGFDTTVHALTMGLRALAHRSDIVDHMLADPNNAAPVINELLRYISIVRCEIRIAMQDFEWHGKSVRTGDIIYFMIGAANHDPRIWSEPDKLDQQNDATNSVAFGSGPHHCLGHFIAKMELSEFFVALFQRFDHVELLPTDDQYEPTYLISGVKRLPIRLHARS